MSDSLRPHGLQHARLIYPSPSPRICSDSCPLSWWCYLTISSSAVLFFFCLRSFPESRSFPMSQLFTSGGQSIGVSASKISASNEHPGLNSFRMDWLDLLAVQGTLKSLLQHHSSKASILQHSAFFIAAESSWQFFLHWQSGSQEAPSEAPALVERRLLIGLVPGSK